MRRFPDLPGVKPLRQRANRLGIIRTRSRIAIDVAIAARAAGGNESSARRGKGRRLGLRDGQQCRKDPWTRDAHRSEHICRPLIPADLSHGFQPRITADHISLGLPRIPSDHISFGFVTDPRGSHSRWLCDRGAGLRRERAGEAGPSHIRRGVRGLLCGARDSGGASSSQEDPRSAVIRPSQIQDPRDPWPDQRPGDPWPELDPRGSVARKARWDIPIGLRLVQNAAFRCISRLSALICGSEAEPQSEPDLALRIVVTPLLLAIAVIRMNLPT